MQKMALTGGIVILSVLATLSVPSLSKLDAQVIILGGGAAGISAAKTLHDGGITDFIVVEAYSKLGGRLRKENFGGFVVELGANEIEGTNRSLGMDAQTNPLWNIAVKKCGLRGSGFADEYSGDIHITYYENGSVADDNEIRAQMVRAIHLGAADSLFLQKHNGTDRSIATELAKFGWKPATPLEQTTDWTVWDYGGGLASNEVSTFAALPVPLNQHGSDDYLINDPRGYAHFVDCMADDFLGKNNSRLYLNTTVTTISWSDSSVCVTVHTTGQRDQERELCAEYAIVTFSVGVLQSKEGQAMFNPQLPEWKVSAIGKLVFVNYLKIFVKFNQTFWDNNVTFIYHVNKRRGYYPIIQPLSSTTSKVLPNNSNILLFYLTEDHAFNVSHQPKNVTKAQVMNVLRKLYGVNIPEPEDILITSWITDPLFRGSFTSVAPGVTEEMYEVAAKPVGNLYFSGEGLCRKYFGTAIGAYLSGITSGNKLLKVMENTRKCAAI